MASLSHGPLLELGARYALHLLHKHQFDRGALTHGYQVVNLWDLLVAGLEGPEPYPQVSLAEIIELVWHELGEIGPPPPYDLSVRPTPERLAE